MSDRMTDGRFKELPQIVVKMKELLDKSRHVEDITVADTLAELFGEFINELLALRTERDELKEKVQYLEGDEYPPNRVLEAFATEVLGWDTYDYPDQVIREVKVDIDQLKAQVKEQAEVIDKLPKCWRLVDGKMVRDVPVVPGMQVWYYSINGYLKKRTVLWIRRSGNLMFHRKRLRHSTGCYSTREAAEAALREKEKGD